MRPLKVHRLAVDVRHKSFAAASGGKLDVIGGLKFSLGNGEVGALVGPSGCGKTTLLRIIAGLDRDYDGSVALPDHGRLGVVFQEPRLLPWLTVADNVGFGLSGLAAGERRGRVAHALERVGLSEHARRWPRELSGGQQQRVAIARAFVTEPKVLLLDEPFSALDAFTRASLHEHLLGLWEESRPTVLLVTHDVQEAVTLADRAVMQPKPGRIFDEQSLHLARPRDRLSPAFESATRRVLSTLDNSLKPSHLARPERGREAAALWW
jgi:sulfonate transport system ATP-binding protein